MGTEWAKLLASHPDRDFVEYILRGISEGFRVGMNPSLIGGPLQSAKSNMQSARDYPEVVDNYLEKECSLGRVVGPLGGMEGVHINRFGVIPKHLVNTKKLSVFHPPSPLFLDSAIVCYIGVCSFSGQLAGRDRHLYVGGEED